MTFSIGGQKRGCTRLNNRSNRMIVSAGRKADTYESKLVELLYPILPKLFFSLRFSYSGLILIR